MNKAELILAASKEAKLTKAQVESVLDAAVEVIQKTVAKGEDVKLVGFGTFSPSVRKEKKGRNPKNGDSLTIPRARIPKFKPGKDFKERVNR